MCLMTITERRLPSSAFCNWIAAKTAALDTLPGRFHCCQAVLSWGRKNETPTECAHAARKPRLTQGLSPPTPFAGALPVWILPGHCPHHCGRRQALHDDRRPSGHQVRGALRSKAVPSAPLLARWPSLAPAPVRLPAATRAIKKTPGVDGLYVYVAPPSMAELERRCRGRLKEAESTIAKRMEWAKAQVELSKQLMPGQGGGGKKGAKEAAPVVDFSIDNTTWDYVLDEVRPPCLLPFPFLASLLFSWMNRSHLGLDMACGRRTRFVPLSGGGCWARAGTP